MDVFTSEPRIVSRHLAQVPIGYLIEGSGFYDRDAEISGRGEARCNGESGRATTDDNILLRGTVNLSIYIPILLLYSFPLMSIEKKNREEIDGAYIICGIYARYSEGAAKKGVARGVGKETSNGTGDKRD